MIELTGLPIVSPLKSLKNEAVSPNPNCGISKGVGSVGKFTLILSYCLVTEFNSQTRPY